MNILNQIIQSGSRRSLSENKAGVLQQALLGITRSVDDPAFPEIALNLFSELFRLDYCHFAILSDGLKVQRNHSFGDADSFWHIYKKHEDHCLFKNKALAYTTRPLPLYINPLIFDILKDKNICYKAISERIPDALLVAGVHPEKDGIIGLRFDRKSLSADEEFLSTILSPHIVHSYFLNKKIMAYKTLNHLYAEKYRRAGQVPRALTDSCFNLIYQQDDFMEALKQHKTSWKNLHDILMLLDRNTIKNHFNANDKFILPGELFMFQVAITPIVVENRYYFEIELYTDHPLPKMTSREREIFRLVKSGFSNSDIAGTLFISVETVKKHLANIFLKTQVKSRTELAAKDF